MHAWLSAVVKSSDEKTSQSERRPLSFVQVSIADWRVSTSQPLTKSPWNPCPVGSPMAKTKGWLSPYHMSANLLTLYRTS